MQPTDQLLADLDDLATPVGFRRSTEADTTLLAAGLQLWESDFALLVLMWADFSDMDVFSQRYGDASGWMSHFLKAEEKKGRLIDGYLLLAFSSKPEMALQGEIRRIESDTGICRKHVIWPDVESSWTTALSSVTTLALPAAAAQVAKVKEPVLPLSAQLALQKREEGWSLDEVASMTEDMPDENSTATGHVG